MSDEAGKWVVVVVDKNTLFSEHDNEHDAYEAADVANQDAIGLGSKIRYKVVLREEWQHGITRGNNVSGFRS